jgi:antitoxin FitA
LTGLINGSKMDSKSHFGAEMSNLSIKDVPEPWAEALRQRAARHHRSLQGELLAMVEAVVHAEVQSLNTGLPMAQGSVMGRRQGTKSVEEIAAEMLTSFTGLIVSEPRAVDIIRAERDAR